MKQFFTVFRFEFKNFAKNKVFIAITLLAILLLGGVLFFPRVKEAFSSGTQTEEPGQEQEIVALADSSGANAQESLAFFSAALPQYEWKLTDADTGALKAKVEDGSYRFALILQSPLKYQYIVANISMTDTVSNELDELIVTKYRADTMQKLGLSSQESQQLLSAQAQGETITLGKDQMKGHRLQMLRMEKNLTQEQMGEKLNLSTSAYCKIEYGETDLTLTRLNKIAEVLNMSALELFNKIDGNVYVNNSGTIGTNIGVAKDCSSVHIEAADDLRELIKANSRLLDMLYKRIELLENKVLL